jgi:hypothetical protein
VLLLLLLLLLLCTVWLQAPQQRSHHLQHQLQLLGVGSCQDATEALQVTLDGCLTRQQLRTWGSIQQPGGREDTCVVILQLLQCGGHTAWPMPGITARGLSRM